MTVRMWLWVRYVPHSIAGLSSKNNKFVFVLEPQKFFIFFIFEALIDNSVNNHNDSIHLSFKKLNFKKLQFYGLGGKNAVIKVNWFSIWSKWQWQTANTIDLWGAFVVLTVLAYVGFELMIFLFLLPNAGMLHHAH